MGLTPEQGPCILFNKGLETMSKQIIGYYSPHKERLLKDFDQTTALIHDWLVARYGKDFANRLIREARQEYKQLIPDIPYITGLRARILNTFLIFTAQELSAYKAMQKHGKSPAEAWEVCHKALRLRVAQVPQWKRGLLRRFMFSRFVRKVMARRARKQQKGQFGNFEIEYLPGDGDYFDLGVNYLQCGNYRFVMEHGGAAFAPYICMSDIALSDAMGWGLIRTQTLADGCRYCDFRFKEGAATQISSKTPAVQKAIEHIRRQEAE